MIKSKTKKKFVTIYWQDHFSDSSWKTEKEIEELIKKQKTCISKGWLVYENNEFIVLAASFDGEESYGDTISILKKNIVI